jgi:glycosyltransferase involved in cell wall biosynthesis
MRLAFVDFTPWDYDCDTPYERPLGGSQSALCYLTEQLARDGHDVLVLNHTTRPGVVRGVEFRPVSQTRPAWLAAREVIVVLNATEPVTPLRRNMARGTRLVLWSQHAHDQPAVAALRRAEVREAFDAFALVSNWQRTHYLREFTIDPTRTNVMRNAMAPAFQDLFEPDEDVSAAKQTPALVSYTSTPFRGLDVLVRVFPRIRSAVPDVTLRVYSSMQVYQVNAEDDRRRYADLYRACDETAGIKRIGSLTQPELARELRRTAVLAYPNHFPETSCIAAIEALASGCLMVTSDLGALGETTSGFARLVPIEGDPAGYGERFIEATVAALRQWTTARAELSVALARQVATMNAAYTWSARARQWTAWLATL